MELMQNFIEQYGVISIFIIVLLEYSNFPIPSELVLPVVGICVSSGLVSLHEAIIVSILSGVIGSVVNYYLGYYLGTPLMRYIVKRMPKMQKSLNSSMWWISKYGELSVMLSRLVPLARTFISIPAGVVRMNIYRYTLFSVIGISIWNVALIYLGYICGNNMDTVILILSKYSTFIIVILIAMIFITCCNWIKKLKI